MNILKYGFSYLFDFKLELFMISRHALLGDGLKFEANAPQKHFQVHFERFMHSNH